MSKSRNAEFNYLEAAQSQKHLTVNDALVRLDTLSQLILVSISQDIPFTASEGACYAVRSTDPNFGDQGGKIAIYDNGGYIFITPKIGWHAYVADTGSQVVFDGSQWSAVASGSSGSAECSVKITSLDQELSGEKVTTSKILPEKSPVFGVTARVIEEITGTDVTSWSIGIAGAENRYGSGLWLGVNGWSRGLTGSPQTYWADKSLVITPDQGSFTAGKVRIYIHHAELTLPPEV